MALRAKRATFILNELFVKKRALEKACARKSVRSKKRALEKAYTRTTGFLDIFSNFPTVCL